MAPDVGRGGIVRSPVPRDKEYYARGRQLYGDLKFEAALSSFKLATWLCSCNKAAAISYKKLGMDLQSLPMPTCHCKTFSANDILEKNADFYLIAKKPCVCGSGIKSCTSPVHLQALDGCAAVSEALKDFKGAHEYSVLLLITAPEHPEGYMRMGKVKRLMSLSASTSTDCGLLYKHGMRNVKKYGDKDHPKLKSLAKLCKAACRTDFVQRLPAEVVVMIFKYLSMRDLCRSMQVSRHWKHATLNRDLWKELDFNGCKAVSRSTLANILNQRAAIKTKLISIRNARQFRLDHRKFCMMVYGLPDLQQLAVRSDQFLRMIPDDPELSPPSRPSKLTRLIISHVLPPPPSFSPFLGYIATALKELAVVGAPTYLADRFPVMPRLETLELGSTAMAQHVQDGRPYLCVDELVEKTPNLRRLCMCGFVVEHPRSIDFNDGGDIWRKLEVLAATDPLEESRRVVAFPCLAKNIRVLDMCRLDLERPVFVTQGGEPDEDPLLAERLENIEYLRCSSALPALPVRFKEFLLPSVENHNLRGLDLCYMESSVDRTAPIPLAELDFLCNADIVDLGLSNFHFPYPDLYGMKGEGQSFLEWVESFPNLHTVAAYPFPAEGCHFAIEGLVRLGIKTIYQDCLIGVERDRIMALAKEKGVTIIHRPHSNRVPRFWKRIEV